LVSSVVALFLLLLPRLILLLPVLLAPLLFWYLLYTFAPYLPDSLKPTINVHLAHVEQTMFNALPHKLMTALHSPALDIVAAIPYTIHIFWPIGFSTWCFRNKRETFLSYLNVFGLVSFVAVLTELVYPCAPPWYLEKYGYAPASYDLPGDPGGLTRLDEYWQTNFYKSTFGNNPVVFGAFPSLHVAWPTILNLFLLFGGVTSSRTKKLLHCGYLGLVVFSVLYLHHHYLVDVLGGMLYALVAYFVVGPHRNISTDNQRLQSFMRWFLGVGTAINKDFEGDTKQCCMDESDGADVLYRPLAGVPTF